MSPSRCTIRVEGLDCPVEAEAIRAALDGASGVVRPEFDLVHGTATVHYLGGETTPPEVLLRIKTRTGFRASLVDEAPGEAEGRSARFVPTIVAGIGLAVGLVLRWAGVDPRTSLVAFGLAIVAGGFEILPKGFRAIGRRQLDIHVLMGLAIAGAVALGEWDEAATVAFLFGLSEALEALSVARAGSAIRSLLEVEPEPAERIAGDGMVDVVAASALSAGDRVRVRAGGRVPIDGTVVAGRSSVDQKAITGEAEPVSRGPGDLVYAGTVNGEGALEVEASGPVGDALISRIVERVKSARANRTPIERAIGRFANVYTPIVVALAVGIMVGPPTIRLLVGATPDWSAWVGRGLVALVVACPCALVIATPVAVASALAAAARRGILIKGGSFLEEFGRLRVLAFDKTGTLTLGEPDVVEVVAEEAAGGDELLRIAAALGEQGGHVLGRAISRHARSLRLEVPVAEGYCAVPGLGASGRVGSVEYRIGSHRYLDQSGDCHPEFHARLGSAESDQGTAVALATEAGPLGWIRLADRPRPEAASVLADLASLGVQAVMLTGDNPASAAAVGDLIGIADRRAGLLPGEKADLILALIAERGPTGMVGDGVNDAPALAAARVSVALGGISSPAAIETADIVLMADDLGGLPRLVRLSRATLSRIKQNIALALAVKAIALGFALVGLATLWMAILADVGTTAIVTANALRLLRPRP